MQTEPRVALIITHIHKSKPYICIVTIGPKSDEASRHAIYKERFHHYYEFALADYYADGIDISSITPIPFHYRCSNTPFGEQHLIPAYATSLVCSQSELPHWQERIRVCLLEQTDPKYAVSLTRKNLTTITVSDEDTDTYYTLRFIEDQPVEEKAFAYKAGNIFHISNDGIISKSRFTEHDLMEFFVVGHVSNRIGRTLNKDYPFPDAFTITRTVEVTVTTTTKSPIDPVTLRDQLNLPKSEK